MGSGDHNQFPGEYTITSYAENVSSLDISVVARKNYYVWNEVRVGVFTPRSLLQQVDEMKGQAAIIESELISFPGDFSVSSLHANPSADNQTQANAKPSTESQSTQNNESIYQKL